MARQKGGKDDENNRGEDSGDENFEDDGGTIQKEDGDKSNGKDVGIQSDDEEDGDKSNGKDGGIQSYDKEDGVVGSVLRIRDKRNENYTEDDMHNQAGENSRNAKSSERKVKNGNVAVVENFNENIEVSLSMATQVLSEFAGESPANGPLKCIISRRFMEQVENMRKC
ncbi:high mobility group nucleosome-binding domain-containing protein 5-like [Drosophila suzukii]|uniref:High mobility group nucleosome-binding domain-containing protein 5-like n=1 Tax=Drosophila suzukii TaxID=28584 RepID=A0ABM4TYM0_DROSZ